MAGPPTERELRVLVAGTSVGFDASGTGLGLQVALATVGAPAPDATCRSWKKSPLARLASADSWLRQRLDHGLLDVCTGRPCTWECARLEKSGVTAATIPGSVGTPVSPQVLTPANMARTTRRSPAGPGQSGSESCEYWSSTPDPRVSSCACSMGRTTSSTALTCPPDLTDSTLQVSPKSCKAGVNPIWSVTASCTAELCSPAPSESTPPCGGSCAT